MSDEVWILGGTGRTGRDAGSRLVAAGLPVVLVGRDGARLAEAVERIGASRSVVAGSVEAMASAIRAERPAVVANTVGPFARTAAPIARACLPHTSYLDLANDFVAARAVLDLHEEAVAAGRTLVTGAGFGVLATEAVAVALCRDRPAPVRIRVDSVPSLALEEGVMGEALASTIIEGVPYGGRRYAGGRLVRAALGGGRVRLELPDGATATVGAWPSGDLVVAERISGAPEVTATTTEVPTGAAVRLAVPVASLLLRVPALQRLAIRRLARLRFTARPRSREHSWGHAVAEWPGERREAWLRLGDAAEFTAATVAAVAIRLADGRGRPGAHPPIAAVGEDVVTEAGGELLPR